MFSFDINGNRLLWFAVGLAAALPGFRASGVAAARSETDLVGRTTPRVHRPSPDVDEIGLIIVTAAGER
jgi:hypothetical protein